MKRVFLSVWFLMVAMSIFAQSEMSFVVEGPEKSYNQVRVVNETSYDNFHCRVVILNADSTLKEVYGEYELKEKGDSDMNTKSGSRILQGSLLGIQFPKTFTGETSFYVDYRDYPLFDVIIIHLTDKGAYDRVKEQEDEY